MKISTLKEKACLSVCLGYDKNYYNNIACFTPFLPIIFIPQEVFIQDGRIFKLRIQSSSKFIADLNLINSEKKLFNIIKLLYNEGISGVTVNILNNLNIFQSIFSKIKLHLGIFDLIICSMDNFNSRSDFAKAKKLINFGYRSFIVDESSKNKFLKLNKPLNLFLLTNRKIQNPSYNIPVEEALPYTYLQSVLNSGINFIITNENFASDDIEYEVDILIKQKTEEINKKLLKPINIFEINEDEI